MSQKQTFFEYDSAKDGAACDEKVFRLSDTGHAHIVYFVVKRPWENVVILTTPPGAVRRRDLSNLGQLRTT